jgi:hypothetical protein
MLVGVVMVRRQGRRVIGYHGPMSKRSRRVSDIAASGNPDPESGGDQGSRASLTFGLCVSQRRAV